MGIRRLKHLFSDLLDVLPSTIRAEWSDPSIVAADKDTVVLVSGFAATERNLSVMRRRLQRDGFNVVILALDWGNLSDGVRGLYRMAELLSQTVLYLRKSKMKGGKVFLVAHSAGGLVARYYVQLLGGYHYCDGIITLGTPHQGTWLALMGIISHLILKARCLFQMIPSSSFIQGINASPWPSGCPLTSISSTDDLMCPPRSAKLGTLPGAAETSSVVLPELSHGDLLLSKTVYRVIKNHIQPAPDVEATGNGEPVPA